MRATAGRRSPTVAHPSGFPVMPPCLRRPALMAAIAHDPATPWISAEDRRLVLNQVRRAREQVDRLARAKSRELPADPDLSREMRWFLWRQEIRRAIAAAELEAWQDIHRQTETWL